MGKIACAIIIASMIFSCANRYEGATTNHFIHVVDKWTGKIHKQGIK